MKIISVLGKVSKKVAIITVLSAVLLGTSSFPVFAAQGGNGNGGGNNGGNNQGNQGGNNGNQGNNNNGNHGDNNDNHNNQGNQGNDNNHDNGNQGNDDHSNQGDQGNNGNHDNDHGDNDNHNGQDNNHGDNNDHGDNHDNDHQGDDHHPAADETAPVIELIGDAEVSVELNTEYSDESATVTDDTDNEVELVVSGVEDVDTSVLGAVYVITYNATDEAGNAAEQVTRTVTIVCPEGSDAVEGACVVNTGDTDTGDTPCEVGETRVEGVCTPDTTEETPVVEEVTHHHGGTHNRVVTAPTTTEGQVLGAEDFQFNNNLRWGMTTEPDVTELQKRLRTEGFFTYPSETGYFGANTFAAVKAYQTAHPAIGYVTGYFGPLTRAEMNAH